MTVPNTEAMGHVAMPTSADQSEQYGVSLVEDGELPTCVRCKENITVGHAYELGEDRWHTHCFTCYRCEKSLSCNSDFLVLGTGALICFECSDSCKSCGKKINDLAIILSSSNEAYCSDCFVCCKCGDNIKDLRYAKTKRGLFCLTCHEKLLAKRKHHEEKKRLLRQKTLPGIPTAAKKIETVTESESRLRSRPEPPSLLQLPQPGIGETKSENKSDNVPPRSPNRGVDALVSPAKVHKLSRSGSGSSTPGTSDQSVRKGNQEESTDTKVVSQQLEKLQEGETNRYQQQTISPDAKRILNKTPLKNSEASTESNARDSGKQEVKLSPESILDCEFDDFEISLDIQLDSPEGGSAVSQDENRHPSGGFSPTTNGIDGEFVEQHVMSTELNKETPRSTADSNANTMTTGKHEEHLSKEAGQTATATNEKPEPPLEKLDERISDSNRLLKNLESDVHRLETRRSELNTQVEAISKLKEELLVQVNELQEEIKNSKQVLGKSLERPKPISTHSDSFSSDDSQTKIISTASLARPANKPRFWKFFSNKQQNSGMASSNGSNGANQGGILYNSSQIRRTEVGGNAKSRNKTLLQQNQGKITPAYPDQLFGSTLIQRCIYENQPMPSIITVCIQHIESSEEYLKTEGIYRKSGSELTIKEIETLFASTPPTANIDLSQYDIHAVSGLLKRYLRNLPNPVITYQLYEPLIDYIRNYNMILDTKKKLQGLVDLLRSLPKEHIVVLKALSAHINLVTTFSEDNLMSIKNLALVFTPGMIRDYTGEREILDMGERNFLMAFILENHEDIF
ncbi:GTPase-activating protein RGA1 KNAG_0B04150 [Huiozyma naganishii CBS 8797]|uniref:Rho-GAP domain-containing protein n=1 Tax=Huiozyma naganishii (strain ATCC MYA-139 / BCRC 22969 / CBS 8797 / KCTC 17520 / NBRC 10181 / NCYC 3082 / Yp74L-3) TaxID=1071383 RepID=J7R210_HUIN7|nr:hypothetical protein KNAG_0B04150 [Kazachstania naganishii CBS 8797]CCK68850.1 hypothetical protein KNAG_0B04150 [Kazachstania naganishii CBS 8797]